MRDPQERWVGVNKAAPVLDAELARYGLTAEKLVLVGFSQGTMMALHVGLRRRSPPAGILGYSGVLVGPDQLPAPPAEGVVKKPPPLLLIHGSEDEVIPVDALFESAEQLAVASFPCQWHLSAGIGHGIDEAGLKIGGGFVSACLGVRTRRPT